MPTLIYLLPVYAVKPCAIVVVGSSRRHHPEMPILNVFTVALVDKILYLWRPVCLKVFGHEFNDTWCTTAPTPVTDELEGWDTGGFEIKIDDKYRSASTTQLYCYINQGHGPANAAFERIKGSDEHGSAARNSGFKGMGASLGNLIDLA